MGWIKDRTSTINAAMGPKRYVLVPFIGAVIGIVDWLLAKFAEAGVSSLVGVPSWAIGLYAATLLVLYWILDYAVKVSRPLADVDSEKWKDVEVYRVFEAVFLWYGKEPPSRVRWAGLSNERND